MHLILRVLSITHFTSRITHYASGYEALRIEDIRGRGVTLIGRVTMMGARSALGGGGCKGCNVVGAPRGVVVGLQVEVRGTQEKGANVR